MTGSYCEVTTEISSHNAVKVFPVLIQYSDWKHGGLQSKSIAVQQQLNEAPEIIAQYIKGTLENCVFLICGICGFLTTFYF
jgi:hypothetical protein